MAKRTLIAVAALVGSIAAASAADKAEQKFMQNAIQGNLAEIQMGQLAQEKAQSADVKSYGQMLVTRPAFSKFELYQAALSSL